MTSMKPFFLTRAMLTKTIMWQSEKDPDFKLTLSPHPVLPGAPVIAEAMAASANLAGVGPMAAVAGAFAEFVGRDLMKVCAEVIVENGGDIAASAAGNVVQTKKDVKNGVEIAKSTPGVLGAVIIKGDS